MSHKQTLSELQYISHDINARAILKNPFDWCLERLGKHYRAFSTGRQKDPLWKHTYINVEHDFCRHLWSHITDVLFSSRDCYNTKKYIQNYSFSWTLLDHMFCCRDLSQFFHGSQFYFLKKLHSFAVTAMSEKIFQKFAKNILTLRPSNM